MYTYIDALLIRTVVLIDSIFLQIFLLLFLLLYISSYALIARFRRRDREDYLSVDEDEATVYRISLWLCTLALAVSIGATLLLPVSIASNEVLILYPNSYYVKWLNSSLIQGECKNDNVNNARSNSNNIFDEFQDG